MDEFGLDVSAAPRGAAEQFQPPEIPWGQNDELALQRASNGLSEIQNQIASGELHPMEAAEHVRQYGQEIAGLTRRKQADMAQQLAQQQEMARHANAMTQGMLQEDAAFDADNFHRRTAFDLDPISGGSAGFYQSEPGKWSQTTYAPAGEMGGWAEGGGEQPSAAAPYSGHQMEIYNGARRSVTTYDASGHAVSQEHYDAEGNLIQPRQQQQAGPGQISPDELQEIQLRANAAVAGMRPGLHRDAAYSRITNTLLANRLSAKRQQAGQQFAVQQQQRKEEARKTQDASAKELQSAYRHHMDRLEKERDKLKSEAAKKGEEEPTLPAYLRDGMIENEARVRAIRELQFSHPHLQTQRPESAAPRGAADTPQAKEAPKVKPLTKEQATDSDVDEALRRRGFDPHTLQRVRGPEPTTPYDAQGRQVAPDFMGGLGGF